MRLGAVVTLGLILSATMLAGCGDDGSSVVVKRPSITQTSPADNAVDVNLNPLIQVWFDQALDETTVDSAAFHMPGVKTHHVEYDANERVISLCLRKILEPESTYEVIVRSSISNANGDSMLADFTFGFTTGPLDCAHLEDYLEPNNSIASATPVELDRTYPALGACSGDDWVDYYEFTVETATKVRAMAHLVFSDTTKVGWEVTLRRGEGNEERYGWGSGPADIGSERGYSFSFLPGRWKRIEDGSPGIIEISICELIESEA